MERSIYKTNERNERFSGIATFECISCKTRIERRGPRTISKVPALQEANGVGST